MHTQRSMLALACAAAMTACGSEPGTSATAGGSSSGDASTGGTSSPATSVGTDDPTTGDTAATSGPATTGPDTTGPATTGPATTGPATSGPATSGPDTDGGTAADTDTGGDTGGQDCAVSWAVPDVPADALAAHDLAWVGCELLACGPDDAPQPGEPSVLCREFSLAGVPLSYLGEMHINDTGVFSTGDVVSPQSFAWLDGQRHVYKYDEAIFIMTEGDAASDQLDVFFAVRALEILRADHPAAWQALVEDAAVVPPQMPLKGFGWKNRLRGVVLSFDTSPLYIAAGLTILDAAPVHDMMTGLDEYSNVLAVSIDRETIRGAMDNIGSRPIYQRPSDDENFLRYLREGLVETVVHELLHPRVDRLNSVDAAMLELYNRRVDPNACAPFQLEEALVAASSLLHFRESGGVSDTYLDYYDVVLDANLAAVAKCKEYPMWQKTFGMPSGLDPRYDLRIYDL